MSSSKAATTRRTHTRSRRGPAAEPVREDFVANGSRYRWSEGTSVVPSRAALADPARRAALPGTFTRTIVPQLERRGARGLVFPAAAAAGLSSQDVRWVAWR